MKITGCILFELGSGWSGEFKQEECNVTGIVCIVSFLLLFFWVRLWLGIGIRWVGYIIPNGGEGEEEVQENWRGEKRCMCVKPCIIQRRWRTKGHRRVRCHTP